ncbi:DUF4232 domain-containing protein [Phytohabitans flavus]|uniref:DUF4232 domain-containing protein n=1 Tax=Phytohabitans flavus TaxID=1076124 RepID=UPI0036348DBE
MLEPPTWVWNLLRLVVGVAFVAPIAVMGVDRLDRDDHHGGRPASSDRVEALPSPTSSQTPTSSPTPAACPDSGLSIRTGGQDAAMGLRVLQLVVTNCGTVARTVRGHPSVRLLDEDRQPLDVAVSAGSSGIATVPSFDVAPATVTLKPGQRAGTALLWRNKVTDGTVVLGHYVEVTVAGGVPPQVAEPEGGIDLGTTGKLGVAPWIANG